MTRQRGLRAGEGVAIIERRTCEMLHLDVKARKKGGQGADRACRVETRRGELCKRSSEIGQSIAEVAAGSRRSREKAAHAEGASLASGGKVPWDDRAEKVSWAGRR